MEKTVFFGKMLLSRNSFRVLREAQEFCCLAGEPSAASPEPQVLPLLPDHNGEISGVVQLLPPAPTPFPSHNLVKVVQRLNVTSEMLLQESL